MDSRERREWFVARTRCGQDDRVASALSGAGLRYLDPEYRGRRSPIPGRGWMRGKVFPGHVFVAVESGHAMLDIPSVLAVFQDEKGRPMCVRPDCMAELELYCLAAHFDDVPPALRTLDLLYGGERLDCFLDYCWNTSSPVPSVSDGSEFPRIASTVLQ